jgi:hypothetical protein
VSTLHNTEAVQLASSIKRQFMLFCLLTGSTALLLAWLSIGFAPSTWWLLFQAIRQFSVLWADQRTRLLWSLLLLIVQSLLLLQAWVLLIRVAVREGSRLYALLSKNDQQVMAAPTASVAATMPASAPSATTPPSPLADVPTQLIQPTPTAPTPDQSLEPTVLPPVQTFPDRQLADAQSQPLRKTRLASSKQIAGAAELMHNIAEAPTQMNALPSPDTQASAQETSLDYPVQLSFPSQQSIFVPEQAEFLEQTIQTSPEEASRNDPYEEFNPYAVNDVFGQEEQISFPELELRSTKQDKLISYSTDASLAIPGNMARQFQQEGLREEVGQPGKQESFQEEAKQPEQQEQPAEEQEQLFVFGNPFEGPLPDVFEHDEDLKRSILEGIELSSGQGSHNQSTAGESKKPSRPKPPQKQK